MSDLSSRIRAVFDTEPEITAEEIRAAARRHRHNYWVLGSGAGVVALAAASVAIALVVSGPTTHKVDIGPATENSSSAGMAAANAEANGILNRVELPSGSREVGHLGGAQFAKEIFVPACNPKTDGTRFWTVPGSVEGVVAYVKAHPSIGTAGSEGSATTGAYSTSADVVMEYSYAPQWQQETLDITIGQLATGQVGVRADAIVVPRSSTCVRGGTAGSTSPPTCTTGQLQLQMALLGGAGGNYLYQGTVRNISTSSCRLEGYPSVTPLEPSGRALQIVGPNGTPVAVVSHSLTPTDVTYMLFRPPAPEPLTLNRNEGAYFDVTYADNPSGNQPGCPAVDQLEVRLPDSETPLTVTLDQPMESVCSDLSVAALENHPYAS